MGTLTAQGYLISTPTQINADLTAQAIAQVPGFNSLPSELRSNLIQESVIVASKFENGISDLMNGIASTFANDFMFYQFGASFGLPLKNAVNSQVTIVFTGPMGTYIPLGTIITNTGDTIEVSTTTDGIINSTGTLSILCESTGTTPISILANTMTILKTAITGVTVNNPVAGTAGLPAETSSQYRTRVQNTFSGPRISQVARAYELLLKVPGVNSNLIYIRNHTVTVVTP